MSSHPRALCHAVCPLVSAWEHVCLSCLFPLLFPGRCLNVFPMKATLIILLILDPTQLPLLALCPRLSPPRIYHLLTYDGIYYLTCFLVLRLCCLNKFLKGRDFWFFLIIVFISQVPETVPDTSEVLSIC